MPVLKPQPGDLFVVDPVGSELFAWIKRGERLIDGRKLKRHPEAKAAWGHVGIASRWVASTLMIVEAEPDGAVERAWHWEDAPHLWSTGILPPCPKAALAALGYAGYEPAGPNSWLKVRDGAGYSFLDYEAIAMHSYHIPAPGLKRFIAATRHQICSQLGDQCRQDGGSHLFNDGRWPGYVTPLDIGLRLQGVQ